MRQLRLLSTVRYILGAQLDRLAKEAAIAIRTAPYDTSAHGRHREQTVELAGEPIVRSG
jgi:hypothetical protein